MIKIDSIKTWTELDIVRLCEETCAIRLNEVVCQVCRQGQTLYNQTNNKYECTNCTYFWEEVKQQEV